MPESPSDKLAVNARTVSLLTLLSRITGLARDATLSRVFGAGPLMDAFFFAFLIPNLFRRLFGEGALSAAFLPAYSRLNRDDPAVARALASLTIARLAVWLGAIVLLGEIILFFTSHRLDHANPAVWLTMVMLPYMPLVCLVAMLGAMLQVRGRFGPTAAAPAILNLAIIATALGWPALSIGEFAPGDAEAIDPRVVHIGIVAASVIIAGLIQVGWSLLALRKHSWWTRDTSTARNEFRRVLWQAGPMILGLGVLQLNTLFDGLIASYPTTVGPTIFGIDYPLTEGAMASVSFAQRLYQFPLGVFGIAIATAIFPLLASQSAEESGFADSLRRGLRLVVYIALPASAGLMLIHQPLTAAVLQGGDFTADDTRRVGFILLGYAPAIWAHSMTHVLTRAFYAREDAKTPVRIALWVVGLNLALNCTLIWTPLREAGLAWSTAICSILQAGLLLWAIRTRLLQTPHYALIDRSVLGSWIRSVAVTALMTLIVGAAAWAMPDIERWRDALWQLAALVALGSVVILLASLALRMPELRWTLGRRTR